MKNYDPNNSFGKNLVQLVFQQWEYKIAVEVVVGGNCKGMSILDFAVDRFFEDLQESQGEYPELIMKDEEGNELETTIEDEEDLKDMLVEAKILSFTKD